MAVPEHLWRFPTAAAISSLAARFNLPYASSMQDWEWEVADVKRIDEFLKAYEREPLSDDEKFTLMETIIQSFAESETDLAVDDRWVRVVTALNQNIALHIYSVWYWSDLENEIDEQSWSITGEMRQILVLEGHRNDFAPA